MAKDILFKTLSTEDTLIRGVAYNQTSINLLNNWLESQRLHYIYSKNFFHQESKPETESGVFSNEVPENPIAFTNTPHPIGNTCLASSLILDAISQIENLNSRYDYGNDKKYKEDSAKYKNALCRYLEKLKYSDDHLKQIETLLTQENSQNTQNQLIAYREIVYKINTWVDKELEKIETIPFEDLRGHSHVLQKVLAKLLVNIGIPTEVICSEVQTLQMKRKNEWLRQHGADVREWGGVDGDGDLGNHMGNVLPIGEGHSWKEIHTLSNKVEANHVIQPRISCKANKNGVTGVNKQLEQIAGVCDVKVLSDLMDVTAFESIYKKFEFFLHEQSLEGVKINHPLDFMARISANALGVSSMGLILSDFDTEQGYQTLVQLMALMACVERYNREYCAAKEDNINQPILPLAENEADILAVSAVMERLFGEITSYYEAIPKEDKAAIERLKKLLVTNCGRFAFGPFSGPSDLTNDVGFMSGLLLERSRARILEAYKNFQQHIDFLKNIELPKEYGVGTAPRRGTNVPRPADGVTMQGSGNLPTSFGLKEYQRLGALQALPKTCDAPFSEAFIKDAITAHKALMPADGKTGLTAEYNRLIKDGEHQKIFDVMNRDYLNNQGTRGNDGVHPYEKQRAITCATIAALFGFNGCGTPLPDTLKSHQQDYNLLKVLNSSSGLKLVMDELLQLCSFDRERLGLLGVKKEVQENLTGYCEGVICLFTKDAPLASMGYNRENGYAPVVEQIVNKILESPHIHVITKRALEQFKQQIPCITSIRQGITRAVENISTLGTEVSAYANLAFSVNQMANFQGLPKIPEDFGMGKRRSEFSEEKPDLSLRYSKAKQAISPVQQMVV